MSKFDAPIGKMNVMNKIFLYFETFSYFISSYINRNNFAMPNYYQII